MSKLIDRIIPDPVRCITGISAYEAEGGFRALKKAARAGPDFVIEEIVRAGLRGRGGAGFPTGRKWAAVAEDTATPKYIICNADEGEPGTFKDRLILEKNPFLLIEGMALAAFTVKAGVGYIYLRGEYPALFHLLEDVIAQCRKKGYIGPDFMGTGADLELYVHRGAGAYICGEETAMIESLEGKRGQPRSRPPYTVNYGYMGKPTLASNVETFANVPIILNIGAESYSKIGSPESPGPKLFSVSGDVVRPGVYELPMGVPLSEIIYEHCGGIKGGRALKAVIPGGVSTAVLRSDDLACRMDFTSKCEGSMGIIGSGAVIVFDEETCMVHTAYRIAKFFAHESCGKCTPCREGTDWIRAILLRMEQGLGVEDDIRLLREVCGNIAGNSFCALGDSAAISTIGFLDKFGDEFEAHIKGKTCPFGGPV
ncbi:MAG: NADH-quinone oxidoreductase subunit NuoF [Thermodesulfovibrionales bacterium]|nr:NADH-quinone oxidoreductase subunit NuoF [Thermodesulfovibrionales bacterium]